MHLFIFYLNYFGHIMGHVEFYFPDQRLNLSPMQWKLEVVTAGILGKSHLFLFRYKSLLNVFLFHVSISKYIYINTSVLFIVSDR